MTTITINRDVFAQHIQGLIEVMRMPNSEHVADAHNKAVRFLRAALAAQPQTLDEAMATPRALAHAYENGWNAATASGPAWHDAPTEPGLWATETIRIVDKSQMKRIATLSCGRWFGPLPEDTK